MKRKVQLIAEAGVNHNGDMEMARKLIDLAADCGADAVKFQTFTAAKLTTKSAEKADYQKQKTDAIESQQSMLAKLELSHDQHWMLKAHAEARGIEFLSSPFDDASADFLVNELKLARIKIPSGEITNAPMLLRIARAGAKVIVSTGMCDLSDIEAALGVLAFGYMNSSKAPGRAAFREAFESSEGAAILRDRVTILHCTSDYPAKTEQVHLAAMKTLRDAFGLPTGYSDHTPGVHVSFAAAALAAECIEKHFTLDKSLPGPDHDASLAPDELRAWVHGIREIEAAIGSSQKRPQPSELSTRRVARKSLVASAPIRAGETFSLENVTAKRPGDGVSPLALWDLLGRKASRSYEADEKIGGEGV